MKGHSRNTIGGILLLSSITIVPVIYAVFELRFFSLAGVAIVLLELTIMLTGVYLLESKDESFTKFGDIEENSPPKQTRKITEEDIINSFKIKMTWEDINEFSIEDQRRLRVFLERAREKEKERNNLKSLEVIAYNIRELKNNDEDYFMLDENPDDHDLRDFLIFKYKPIIFYNQDFKFSDDIQKKMSENPFLMEGEIGKIYRKNNRNFITLSGFTGLTANNKSFFDLKFSCKLEANKKQLAYIENKTKEDDFLNNFFAVANISKFSFPETQNNATDDETAKNIFLSSLFSMEGNLIDIIKDE